MVAVLSLDGWGDIAQFVIAVGGVGALIGVYLQLRFGHATSRRARVYDYADCFNKREMLRASAEYVGYWESHTFADFDAMSLADQLEHLMMANLIEEVAFLYNRNLLDRNVAADILGFYVERLWNASSSLVNEVRTKEGRATFFSEWEEMQADTPGRSERNLRERHRRLAWRKYLRSLLDRPH
jgi:hypothetical protein